MASDIVAVTEGTGKSISVETVTTLNGASVSSRDIQRVAVATVTADGVASDVTTATPLAVSLPAATVTTLTPPAAITGFSTAANQATEIASLASILAKQSADPSTGAKQDLLLAKIIAAPATEAKQDALAALIGEVQASPTTNTLLERLKAIQTALAATLTVSGTLTAVTTVGTITNVVHVDDNAGSITVDGTFWQATQPVSAASLPLPSGAATSAAQTTAQTSLSSIDTKTPALGQALAAASTPVVLTAIQQAALTPPAAITGFSTSALQGSGNVSLDNIDTKLGLRLPTTLGQKAMASALAVSIASDQSAVPVSGTVTANIGTVATLATAAKQPALGTAGSASTDVITVQGIAGGTGQPIVAVNLVPTFTPGSSLNADLVAAFDASNYRSGSLQLTGTWVGTVQVQASMDAGTTWVALRIRKQDGTYSTSQTAVGIYEYGVPTGAQIRIRITAYTSGTVTGAAALTSMPFAPIAVEQTPTNLSATAVSGPTASGVADSGAPVKGATKYNATPPTFADGNRADMQGDANGFLRVTAQPTNTIASTPTVSTTPAYTSGDSVGGKISLASAVRLAGTGGTITSVTITDKGKQSAATDVVFFNADPSNTTFTDNGALTVHDTDLLTIIGVVPITSWAAFVDNSVGYANGLGLGFKIASGTTLYACLVTRGTPTYTATTDIQLTICIIPD
jgi:hypothetical protein